MHAVLYPLSLSTILLTTLSLPDNPEVWGILFESVDLNKDGLLQSTELDLVKPNSHFMSLLGEANRSLEGVKDEL